MPSWLFPVGISVIAVLATELIMWHLFSKRIDGLHFPHSADTSHLRFFSFRRVQICALIHSVFVAGALAFFFILIW